MKTLWIEDEDALNVGRVIVTKTGTKDCVVCYSCDEVDDYENRLKADMVAMLTELKKEIMKLPFDDEEPINITQEYLDELKAWEYGKKDSVKVIQQKINALKGEGGSQ